MFKVYKIVNIKNNKVYIGYTSKTLEERLKKHIHSINESDIKIRRAIKKHGKENFYIELIEEFETKQLALAAEIKYIKEFNSYISGYNSTLGGESPSFYGKSSWKPETKKKISDSVKRWYDTDEGKAFKQKQSILFKDLQPHKFVTPEQRKAASEKYKNWLLTEKGQLRLQESRDNMKKVQKIRHNGTFQLTAPNGQIYTTTDIISFCKEHNLSYNSFYYSLKLSKKKISNNSGKNKGWIINKWNEKPE